jgi:molybdopterin synthase catalytic subunit
MDWLKTKAPFWKLEETGDGERWVEAHAEDESAAVRWKS